MYNTSAHFAPNRRLVIVPHFHTFKLFKSQRLRRFMWGSGWRSFADLRSLFLSESTANNYGMKAWSFSAMMLAAPGAILTMRKVFRWTLMIKLLILERTLLCTAYMPRVLYVSGRLIWSKRYCTNLITVTQLYCLEEFFVALSDQCLIGFCETLHYLAWYFRYLYGHTLALIWEHCLR